MTRILFIGLFWLGVVALVLVSLIPDVSLPARTIEAAGFRARISVEALAHFSGCALLAWLYVRAYGFRLKGVGLMLGLGVASEVIQYLFTAGRNIEVSDLTWNTLGVGFGMLVGWVMSRRRRSRRWFHFGYARYVEWKYWLWANCDDYYGGYRWTQRRERRIFQRKRGTHTAHKGGQQPCDYRRVPEQ